MTTCDQCGGTGVPLGICGDLEWWRCRQCGWQWSGDSSDGAASDRKELCDDGSTRLGDIATAHIWFSSVGQPAGCDLVTDEGEQLEVPHEEWWDLLGTVEGGKWIWNGGGSPTDFRQNSVLRIVAFT